MNIRFYIASLVLFSFMNGVNAQVNHSKHNYIPRYTQSQIIDSCDGANLYRRLMNVLEEDYVQLKSLGYDVQGWNEEYFESGQLMHISYYKDGKAVLFKNFYENGQCQHYITYTDSSACNIDMYFEDGALKHQLTYCNGKPKKIAEFYQSGLPKVLIEFDQEADCVSSKKFWFRNAEIQEEIKLEDAVAKKYSDTMYFPNGQLKEKGELIYVTETKEYVNVGSRTTYESSGKKNHTTKYHFSQN